LAVGRAIIALKLNHHSKVKLMLNNYLKIAGRNLSRHKAYAAINIFGLAFGLAAFWMIVLFIADELSYDRFNTKANRISRVVQHARWGENDLHLAPTSAPFAPALKAEFPEIQEATRILTEGGGIISYNNKSLKAGDIFFADKNIFQVFTFPFLYGDPSTALGEPQAIVINESMAVRLFGDAQKALNQTVYFENNFPNKVTGVIKDIPQNSHLRFSALRSLAADYSGDWQNFNVYTYVLLKEGKGVKNFETKLAEFAAKTIKKIMKIDDYKMEVQALTSIHLYSALQFEISPNGSISRVFMFIAIAVLILIIAIINYINLTTARSASRVREVGIRKVVGSGKRQLGAMFITESVLVTIIAASIGVFIIVLTLPLFNHLTEKQLSVWRFGKINTILLLAGFSVFTGIVSGIYPSLFLSRFKTIPALKGQMGNLSANILFRKSLVVFQFVITVVMITGSLVIYRQLQYALHKNLGFNKDQLLTFHIDDQDVRNQAEALKTQLLQNSSVEAVAVAGNPIGNNDLGGLGYNFETQQGNFSTSTTVAQQLMIDADYIPALKIKMLTGRNFSNAVQSDKYGAALINETLMKQVGWTSPIGKRMHFRIDEKGTMGERSVIGVIKDFHTYSLQHKVEPLVMVMPPAPSMGDNLYVRIAKGKIHEGLAYMDKVYRRFDKTSPLEYHFLDTNFSKQYSAEEKQGRIALLFTMLAIVISCLGLFGLAAFSTEQRTKEIGIRKVLGASVAQVTILLSKDFLQLVLIATVIAFPIAWWAMNSWLQDFAYRINITWWMFAIAGVVAIFIALFAISFQAIKAAAANPVRSLRTE
jgi:putative ABC transport system permease protein